MEYIYNNIPNTINYDIEDNITNEPYIQGIHNDIANSNMVDKSIDWCRWDEDTSILEIYFINILSSQDKLELDTIVSNNS